MVKHTMELKWKDHPVDLEALEKWLKTNAGEDYCGNSADVSLKLHFLEEPSEETKQAIQDKWEELDETDHEMCKSYKTREERAAAKKAAKEAAIKALAEASGLNKEQVEALLS